MVYNPLYQWPKLGASVAGFPSLLLLPPARPMSPAAQLEETTAEVRQLRELVDRLVIRQAELEVQVRVLSAAGPATASSSSSPQVTVNVHPLTGGAAAPQVVAEAAPVASEASSLPTSVAEPSQPEWAPTAMASTCEPLAQIKHYCIYKPNSLGKQGVTQSYEVFANSVRDWTVEWSGKGKLPWAHNASGKAYSTKKEAEEAYRSHFAVPASTSVPHWA